jgi:CHAT domain-containing protein
MACGAPRAPLSILAERCLGISGAAPIALEIASPGGGTLRITVRQRGISLTGSLIADATSAASVSPIDRYGALTLVAQSRQAGRYTLRIASRDSADIGGEACVSADLINDADRARLAAEQAFADGGRATQARHWQSAFDDYQRAARGFDHIDRQRSAEARHAMAQLAYRQLDRNRDSYVLAERALPEVGAGADTGLRSALVALQATSVVESTDENAKLRRERVLRLLDTSKALAARARFGARELPRLTILRGFLEYAMDNAAAASVLFKDAAAQCKALHDWECYARAHQNFAELTEENGDNQVALQGYADALRFLNPAVAPELTADIWDNLGRLQGSVGIFTRAQQSYLSSTHLYAQLDDCDGVRRVLAHLGRLLVEVGSVGDAVDYLQRATSLACPALMLASNGEPSADAKYRASGASASGPVSPTRASDSSCTQPAAAEQLTADGKFAVFDALLALSEVATLEGRPDAGTRCLALASGYTVSPKTQLRLANATGRVLLEKDQGAAARASFEEGIRIAEQAHMQATDEHRPTSFLGLAQAALLERQPEAARRYALQSLTLSSTRADIGQVVASLQILGRVLRASGEPLAAIRMLKAAANLTEQVPIDELDAERRATYLATQHGVFAELTDLLIANASAAAHAAAPNANAAWAAFNEAERGHARSFRYALNQTTGDDPRAPHERVAVKYQELLRHVAATMAARATAAEVNTLVERHGALSDAEPRPERVDSAALTAQLDQSQATLVEYATGRHDMYAFVVESGDIHIVQLASLKSIAAAAADLFDRLHDPEGAAADIQRASQRLAELALWPVTRFVSRERVIFVPDDSLNTVPFAVLPWSQGPGSALVVQRVEASVAPSALFLMHHPEAHAAPSRAARFELIGDPVFRIDDWRHECLGREAATSEPLVSRARGGSDWTQSLPRLPGSRAEILAIAALARATRASTQISVRLGCLATPDGLRQAATAAPQLLHIATHGYVDALRPRLSALALSRDSASSSDGGVFGLLDILDIRLNSRLVVLSACDTSRGRLLPGEGVLGPAQAFLQSGAASVLASYWRIDDAATAAFMRSFYKYLLREHVPVAAALRRAQLEQLSAGTARTWAAFALYGWPDSSI